MFFLFGLQIYSVTFLILRRIHIDIVLNVHFSLGKIPVMLVIISSSIKFSTDFVKSFQIPNFIKIRPVGANGQP